MADNTKIEWTHRPGTKGETLNPIRARNLATSKVGWYCEHVSEACRHCYAECRNLNTFFGNGLAYKPGCREEVEIFLDEETLVKPLHWAKPRTIFLCSMTDLFGDFVQNEWIDRIFAVATMCPQHRFIVLTKRARRMQAYMVNSERQIAQAMLKLGEPKDGEIVGHHFQQIAPRGIVGKGIVGISPWPLPNVWLGVTTENQETAEERIPYLLNAPAAIRFLSCEPLLGPIDLTNLCAPDERTHGWSAIWRGNQLRAWLDWVICGGESGPAAKPIRPMHPEWARAMRDQCNDAGVPFFFKQWGEWQPAADHDPRECGKEPEALHVEGRREYQPSEAFKHLSLREAGWAGMCRVGREAAGRLLDGREHNEFPRVAA